MIKTKHIDQNTIFYPKHVDNDNIYHKDHNEKDVSFYFFFDIEVYYLNHQFYENYSLYFTKSLDNSCIQV